MIPLVIEGAPFNSIISTGAIPAAQQYPMSCNDVITTGRGKEELNDLVVVEKVDHEKKIVYARGKKATLNAPLLDIMFKKNEKIKYIVHYHQQYPGLYPEKYAPPGTVRDVNRSIFSIDPVFSYRSFNIKEHGCMLAFDEKGNMV